MWNLKRNDTNKLTYKTETDSTDFVNELMVGCQREGWEEGIVMEFGMDMYTQLYLKWLGLSWASLVAQIVNNLPAMRQFKSLGWEDPLEKEMAIHCNILGASHVVLAVKKLSANAGDMRLKFDPWVGKIPWRRAWQPTPVFLPGESHRQRSLTGYSP